MTDRVFEPPSASALPQKPTAPKTPQTTPDTIDEDEAFPRTIDEDEAFPPLTPEQQRKQVHAALGGSPLQDFLFGDEDLSEGIPIVGGSIASKFKHLGNVARATRDAFKEGFGPEPLVPSEEELHGVSKETVDYLKKHGWLKDYIDGQKEVSDAADTHLLKPIATEQALQYFLRGFVSSPAYQAGAAGIRGFNAAWHAADHGIYSAGQEYGFPKLAGDLSGMLQAFMGSPHPTGVPGLTIEKPLTSAQRILQDADRAQIEVRSLTPEEAAAGRARAAGLAPGLQEHAPLTATELANAKSLGALGDEETWKSDAKPPADAVLPAGTEGVPTPSEPPTPSIDEQKATIAADVTKQMVDAGRPRQEAEDLGTILANRYVTRAGLFKGERGTPEELYRQESAQIRAEGIGAKLQAPAARNAAAGFVERMAVGQEQAQKRRNEGGSAVRVMTTAGKYAGVTEEEFNAAKSEAVGAAPELKTLMTDADWEFMASPEFHQRKTASEKAIDKIDRELQRMDWGSPEYNAKMEERQLLTEGEAKTLDDLRPAYDAARTEQGGISTVYISDIVKNSGLPVSDVHRVLKDSAQRGEVSLNRSSVPEANLSPEQRAAAVAFPGDPYSYHTATFARSLAQGAKQGGIVLNPAHFAVRNYLGVEGVRPLMRFMKSADASTGIHEFGHQFLAELLRDADHELAPEQLRTDAKTVLDWLKAKREDFDYAGNDKKILAILTGKHEKFARGFEQYMRKGEAPSPELASVFARFREWLLSLYHTIKGLGKPISPAMQDVFDRLLVIEPKRVPAAKGAPETFADRHDVAGRSAAPEAAHETRETLASERDNVAAQHLPPELNNARLESVAESPERRTARSPELDRDGNATGPEAGARGTGQEPGAVGAGGGEAGPSGAAAPSEKPGPSVTTKPPEGSHAKFDEEKAGNIVLRNVPQEGFGDPETFREFVKQSAARNNNFMAERQGVMSDVEALMIAQTIGKDPSFIDRKAIGDAWTKPEIFAIEQIFNERTAKLRDAAIKAKTGSPEDALAFEIQKQELEMMADTVQGKASAARAQAGRSLQAYSALARMRKRAAETDAASAFKEITGLTLFQSKLQARFAAGLNDPAQMALFVDTTRNKGFWHAVIEYYVNALISGPITHARYAVGNMAKMLVTPLFEIPVGAAVGKVREITGAGPQADRVYLGEVAPALYGIMKGSREGLWKAWDALQTGISEPLPGEKISPHFMTPGGAIPGQIGTVIRTPGRAVSAIHTFFKMATYEMSIQRLAYRTAMNEGLDGVAFDNRVAELTVRPTSTMMTQATRGALKELFMAPTDYDSVSGQLTRAFNNYSPSGIALKVIAPFMKIGMQITKEAFVERTPVGLISKEVRENLSFKGGELDKGGGAAFDEQMAKQITGIALIGTGVGLTLEGLMTGDGPEEPQKRAVWLLSHKPNSIQIGDISIPYQGLGGLGMLLRFAANMTHTAQGWNDEDGGTLALHFMQGFTKSVLDENFMRGIKDMLDAMYHPKEYGTAYIRQFATNWLPFSVGMGQVARMVDPYQRETDTIFKAAQAKVPWLSKTLMPRRDIFGEPIPNNAAEAIARYKDDPVMRAMNELQFGVGKLRDEIKGVDLTDQQFDDLSKMAGRMAKMRLDRLVRMPGFERMAPEMRIELMHKNINDARNTARKIIQAQNPGITRAAVDNKVGKLTGTVRPNQKPVQAPAQ